MAELRLQKYMAQQGICSRRQAEVLIAEGKVKVNGTTVREMGVKIDSEKDKIEVVGFSRSVHNEKLVYIMLNKPVGYISSASDAQGQTVLDLLTSDSLVGTGTPLKSRVYPVGRLDKDSEGLVLLTNDGELTNALTHPRYEHEKEYEVIIDAPLTRDAKKVLETGMDIGGGEYVHGITILNTFNKGRKTIVTVILTEGKNRQIRKMFGRLGYTISTLRRTRINKLKLGVLPVGKWRYINRDKIV